MRCLAAGLGAALLASSTLAAAPAEFAAIDAKWKACLATNESTPGVNGCNEAAHAAADAILNRTYSKWVGELSHPASGEAADNAEVLKRLVASERAWVVYRDRNCDLESTSMLGGSGESNVYSGCLYIMTKQRALDLERVGQN